MRAGMPILARRERLEFAVEDVSLDQRGRDAMWLSRSGHMGHDRIIIDSEYDFNRRRLIEYKRIETFRSGLESATFSS